jgi:hypothetical protein
MHCARAETVMSSMICVFQVMVLFGDLPFVDTVTQRRDCLMQQWQHLRSSERGTFCCFPLNRFLFLGGAVAYVKQCLVI